MKLTSKFNDVEVCKSILEQIKAEAKISINIMSICSIQSKAIQEHKINELLPDRIKIIEAPIYMKNIVSERFIGYINKLKKMENIILTGKKQMLENIDTINIKDNSIKIVSSYIESLKIAEINKDKEIVFIVAGFENEAPIGSLIIKHAKLKNITNFSMLMLIKTTPDLIKRLSYCRRYSVDGFLCSENNAMIIGEKPFYNLSMERNIPISICGTGQSDILNGILEITKMINNRKIKCHNLCRNIVKKEGNIKAKKLINDVFKNYSKIFMKMHKMQSSQMTIKNEYEQFNAVSKFDL